MFRHFTASFFGLNSLSDNLAGVTHTTAEMCKAALHLQLSSLWIPSCKDALITDKPALAIRLLNQRAEMNPVERLLVTTGLLLVGETEHIDPKTDGM